MPQKDKKRKQQGKPSKEPHYKNVRKDKRLEKNLRSTFGNDLKNSDYGQQYQSKRKQFNDYDVDEEELFEPRENNRRPQQSRGQSYQGQKDSDIDRYVVKKRREYNSNSKPHQNKRQGDFKNNRNQRFQGFKDHLQKEQIQEALQKGELFQGIILMNEYTRQLASIKSPSFEQKIFINSVEDQNRTFNGATVAFKVIKVVDADIKDMPQESPYVVKKESRGPENKEEEENIKAPQAPYVEKKNSQQKPQFEDEVAWDSEEDIPIVFKYYEQNPEEIRKNKEIFKDKKVIAKVVGIIKDDTRESPLVGKIQLSKKEDRYKREGKDKTLIQQIQEEYSIYFVTNNKKLPWFKIGDFNQQLIVKLASEKQINSVEQIIEMIDQYYFKGEFLAWDKKQSNPTVKIVDIVGQTGDIETECRALLTEHQVYTDDFDEECAIEMQKYKEQCNEEGEYIIPEEERKRRLDLTKEIICTVDPLTARDLDDALSVNEVEDGIFEVGVHIADVSHFVEPITRVDEEAKLRTTSVYLVHRVIPMLPRILCENLCSLNPQVERLAFSVFFYITRDGEVLWDRKPRVHKSIISSVAKLSYDVVNEMIEGKVTQIAQIEDKYKVAEGVDRARLFDKLMLLNQLGQKRREKRLQAGSLIMETNKLRFELDEAQNPVRYQSDTRGAAQFMVEEWMLLANQFVGQELVRFNQKQAVLRKHEPPQSAKVAFFKRLLTTCNLTDMIESFNISSSDKLASILEKINARQDVNQVVKDILSFKLVKLLEAAKYFVVKDSEKFTWHHFALNFEVYTHFTSPIRRYPDILVHRLLHQTIDANAKVIRDEYLDTLMNRSNQHKLSAKRVSDGCQKIFMCLYLKKNPVISEAMIMELNGAYINIIVPQFNLELKRFTKDLKNITKSTLQTPEKDQQYLLIEYKDQTHPNGHRIHILEAFTKIQVQLTSTQSFPIDYQVNIIIPQRRTNENGERVTVPYII